VYKRFAITALDSCGPGAAHQLHPSLVMPVIGTCPVESRGYLCFATLRHHRNIFFHFFTASGVFEGGERNTCLSPTFQEPLEWFKRTCVSFLVKNLVYTHIIHSEANHK